MLKSAFQQAGRCLKNSVNIVPIGTLTAADFIDAVVLVVNRESTEEQKPNHDAKIAEILEACEKLGISSPLIATFEGCGSTKILRECFVNLDTAVLSGGYWEWLQQQIRISLFQTPLDQKLYVFFYTESRLMRPQMYNGNNKSTSPLTPADHDLLGCWLWHCFGERAADIVFVMLHTGTESEQHSRKTKAGQKHWDRKGGRPRNLNSPQERRRLKEILRHEAIKRVSCTNKAGTIYRYFERKYGTLPMKKRTLQNWLQEKGCSQERGCPKGTRQVPKRCVNVRIDNFTKKGASNDCDYEK